MSMQTISAEGDESFRDESGSCNCRAKTRFISALITFILGACISFSCFFVYPSDTFVTFISVGTVLGIITTFILATPKRHWRVWKAKTGSSIAAVVMILIFAANVVVGIVFEYWALVLIFNVLEWLLLFVYCIIIIEGGIEAVKAAFSRSMATQTA